LSTSLSLSALGIINQEYFGFRSRKEVSCAVEAPCGRTLVGRVKWGYRRGLQPSGHE
jgi:hypothetical protein